MLGIRNGRQPQLDNTPAIVNQRAPGGTGRGEKEDQAVTVHGTITASGGDLRAHCTHPATETVGGLTSCAQCGETVNAGGD